VSQGDACATDRAVRKLVELRRYAERGYAARVMETATRIRVAFASDCPDAALYRTLANQLRAASP